MADTLIKDQWDDTYRDFAVEGLPVPGTEWEPRKPDIRALGAKIEALLSAVISGRPPVEAVVAAATGNVNIASGLTNGSTHDGVVVSTGQRVALPYQTDPTQSGIYIVAASGAASRSTDANSSDEMVGLRFYVNGGTVNGLKTLQCATPAPIVLGTTPLQFVVTGNDANLSGALTTFNAAKTRGFVGGTALLGAAPQLFNGATIHYNDQGQALGLNVPTGQTGQNSIIQAKFDLRGFGALLAGRTVKITMGFNTSASLARTTSNTFQVNRPGGVANLSTVSASSVQVSTFRRVVTMSAVLDGTETGLWPYSRLNSPTAAVADEFMYMTDFASEITSATSDVLTTLAENAALSANIERAASVVSTTYAVTVTAGAGKDYATPKLALAAITDASPSKRYKVLLYEGDYTDIDWFSKDDVDIIGVNRRLCHLKGSLPDNVDPTTIQDHQTLWGSTNSLIANVTISCRNMRYPYHPDVTTPVLAINKTMRFENVSFIHYGNQGAYDYQVGLGGSGNPSAVWQSTDAFGSGLASGCAVYADNCSFEGVRSGFAIHNRRDATDGLKVRLRNCLLSAASAAGYALLSQSLSSHQGDSVELLGCELNGDILNTSTPWGQNDLGYQPSRHAELRVYGSGNTAAVATTTDTSKALVIISSNTLSSGSVAASGTGATALLGSAKLKAGGGGIAAALEGELDVENHTVGTANNLLITSMGKRLGDCSSVSKTLTLSINGGAAINVVFNTDMTAVSNSTILGTINTALGYTGASLVSLGSLYRPKFYDEERDLLNSTVTGIPRGSVLAYDGGVKNVRLMTSADAASLFAGVAMDDIVPGASGRIKTAGYLILTDILRDDALTIAFGDTFSISASAPGKIVKGGSGGLLMAIRSDAVRVGNAKF